MKPLRAKGFTAKFDGPPGFLGYVHARFYRDSDGKEIGNVSISRDNYRTTREHRAAFKAELLRAIAKAEVL